MKKVNRRSNCPISFALEIFGDRWSLLIIRDLMFMGKTHYGDFLGSEEKIATNILADRLEMLERAGVIKKSRDEKNKTKHIYSLTSKGLDLMPILMEIVVWSNKYGTFPDEVKSFVKLIKKNRNRLVQKISSGLAVV